VRVRIGEEVVSWQQVSEASPRHTRDCLVSFTSQNTAYLEEQHEGAGETEVRKALAELSHDDVACLKKR